MWWLHYLMMAFSFWSFAQGQFDTFVIADPDTLVEETVVLEKWKIMESRIKDLSEEVFKGIYPMLMDMMGSSNISRTCFRDSAKLLLGLRNLNTWAVKFLDSSTKSFDGLLNIKMPSFGSYDECVDNKVPAGRSEILKRKVMFQGKYCNVNVRPYLQRDEMASLIGSGKTKILQKFFPEGSVFSEIAKLAGYAYAAPVKLGLCVPSGCSTEDVNVVLQKATNYFGISIKAQRCSVKEEKKCTTVVLAIMAVYCSTGFLVLLGTAIDIYIKFWNKKFQSTGMQILRSFSFISNFEKLTNTSSSSSTECLNGMRFLSLSWVILGHTLMIMASTNHNFPRNFEDYLQDFAVHVIINGTFSVDTFFFLSGFLVCYTTVKLVKVRKNSFSVSLYIIHRLIRLLPAYAFVIGFEFIKPLTGSGPLFYEMQLKFTENCEKNWWSNLLFINNFYQQNEMCLPHTWFTAVDMQLYILALIVILPLIWSPRIGICIASAMTVGCVIAAGVMSYIHNMMAILILSVSREELDYYHHYHNMNPYLHVPPYCIGMLLGYILATCSSVRISKVCRVLGWTISTATCLAVVYGVHKWNTGVRPTVWENAIYSALSRTAWSLGVAWMTFMCCTGNGGVVNYILSWKIWTPLSRLTYFAYLVHLPVVMSFGGNMRAIPDFEYFIVVWIYFGHLVVTYGVAFAGSMLIEAPFLSLEKVLLRGNSKNEILSSGESKYAEKKNEEISSINHSSSKLNGLDEKSRNDFTHV